jgi:hypothetical protein
MLSRTPVSSSTTRIRDIFSWRSAARLARRRYAAQLCCATICLTA